MFHAAAAAAMLWPGGAVLPGPRAGSLPEAAGLLLSLRSEMPCGLLATFKRVGQFWGGPFELLVDVSLWSSEICVCVCARVFFRFSQRGFINKDMCNNCDIFAAGYCCC